LEVKKEKNASKEALDATSLAKFFFGPGGRQAGTMLLAFRIPSNDRHSSKYGMNPSNEAQAPIRGVPADDTRTDLVEPHGPR
jgi:hypothetical protein